MRVFLALLFGLVAAQFASAEPCGPGGPVFAIVPGTVKVTLRAGGTLTATLIYTAPQQGHQAVGVVWRKRS